jgi:hypothetical protein
VIVAGAVVAVAVAGALIGLAASGSFSSGGARALPPMPTTGDYAPFHFLESPSDPDSDTLGGQDMTSVLTRMQGHSHYRLEVSNISNLGVINGFNWIPPTGMKLVQVSKASSGSCRISASPAAGGTQAFPALACTGVSMKAPSCTCRGDGGKVTVLLVARNGDDSGFLAGASQIVSATLAYKAVPGYVQAAPQPSGSGSTTTGGNSTSQG